MLANQKKQRMYLLKTLLIGLDLSDLDKTLIDYTSVVANTNDSEKIIFVSIIKDFNLPDDLRERFPDLERGALKERKEKIEEKLDQLLDKKYRERCEVLVYTGSVTKRILRLVEDFDVDLIILGKRKKVPGRASNSGILIQRLARRSNCSLLIVPEGCKPKIKRLLVPIDFKTESKNALEEAILLARKANQDTEIYTQCVYSVPSGYHYSGKSYEEFSEIIKEHTRKDFKEFIKDIEMTGVDIHELYTLDSNDDHTTEINDMANNLEVDGVIIGVRTLTKSTSLFLSSKAEKLIGLDSNFPLTVVRAKNKDLGLLDYIRNL